MRPLKRIFRVVLVLEAAVAGAQVVEPREAVSPSAEARLDDRITLKSGRVLQGVKIIHTTPFKLVLEVIPTVEPLEIPARQVVSVTYGERRPEPEAAPAEEPPSTTQDDASHVLPAVKIAPELVKKLSAPLTGKSVDFTQQDLLNTLRSAGILFGVSVTFGPALEKLPLEERITTLRLSEGQSFQEFIRNAVAQELPWLTVEYRFDTVHFDRV